MKLLGIDTSTRVASVAVVDDTQLLADATSTGRNTDVLVAIDDACRRAGITPLELDAVCVGAGPGSFTGLRIGMATAKGIAFAAGKPLWAASSLAALAWDAAAAHDDPDADAGYIAVLDARRSEVFAGCYASRPWTQLGDERVMPPAELASWVRATVGDRAHYFAGDAVDVYHLEALGTWLAPRTPSGYAVTQVARRTDILTSGVPAYIRPSEAEVLYPDGVPGALRRP